MDGSRDGDVTTLHVNGRYRNRFEDVENFEVVEQEVEEEAEQREE